MGLRCLFGHDFTEPELERDRETSGGEVVITVREVKTCRRCGETQIVSENKEVTSVEQLAETARGIESDDESPETAPDTSTEAVDAGQPDAAEIDAADDAAGTPSDAHPEPESGNVEMDEGTDEMPDERTDEMPDERTDDVTDDGVVIDGAEGSQAGEEGELEADEVTDAEEDDGIILDDDGPTDPDRTPGAWPDANDTRKADEEPAYEGGEPAAGEERTAGDDIDDAEASPWPDQHGEDEGYDAEPGGGTPEGVSFDSGLRPEATDGQSPEDDEGVEFIDGSESVTDTGGRWPDPTDAPDESSADSSPEDADERASVEEERAAVDDDDTAVEADAAATGAQEDTEFTRAADAVDTTRGTPFETEFFCPECGHSAPTEGSSLRTGDICPECRRGYIAERERTPER